MKIPDSLKSRARAATCHAGISGLIAATTAVVMISLWYPGLIGTMAGGKQLFFLVLGVDVVTGPLLTFVIFDDSKPRSELVRDLTVIAIIQVGALVYGLNTVYVARPVAVVHEPGRFRLVTANDVRAGELSQAREEYRTLPLTGPLLLGTRAARSGSERFEAVDLALKGFDVGQRPTFWQPYAESRAAALDQARPVSELIERYPDRKSELLSLLRELQLEVSEARFLPVLARNDGVAIMNSRGDVAGFARFDGF